MTDKEVMQMALDALESWQKEDVYGWSETDNACVEALRAALAQPELKPVAWADKRDVEREGHDFWVSRQQPAKNGVPLYTATREWVGLTDEEAAELCHAPIAVIEAKLKNKNK